MRASWNLNVCCWKPCCKLIRYGIVACSIGVPSGRLSLAPGKCQEPRGCPWLTYSISESLAGLRMSWSASTSRISGIIMRDFGKCRSAACRPWTAAMFLGRYCWSL